MLNDHSKYDAMVRRDRSLDGVFFAGVKTTGIFCRPGCGAKKPNRENVEFFDSTSTALHAGYRPCKRCRPMHPQAAPTWLNGVMQLAEDHKGQRLTAADLRGAGIDPVRAARYFKSNFGMTFQAYHRALRIGAAVRTLNAGDTVIHRAFRAGFESESGFRSAFEKVFGKPATTNHVDAMRVCAIPTPIGPMLAAANDQGVCLLEFVDRRGLQAQIDTLRRRFKSPVIPGSSAHLTQLERELKEYFSGTRAQFSVPLVTRGTEFQMRTWNALLQIKCGETASYAQLARTIGQPTAVRAVARANGDNRIAIIIPCHRVIGSDGSMTGYGGHVWRKQWLLDHERSMKPLRLERKRKDEFTSPLTFPSEACLRSPHRRSHRVLS